VRNQVIPELVKYYRLFAKDVSKEDKMYQIAGNYLATGAGTVITLKAP